MWTLIGGIFMGWSLGANDAANLFGPAVTSRTLRFWTAAGLASVFVVIGAVFLGSRGFSTYEAIGELTRLAGFVVTMAAALTVSGMTFLGLPVSTTQAVVGGIIGATLAMGRVPSLAPLLKVALSWVLTPVGGAIATYVLYRVVSGRGGWIGERLLRYERLLQASLILATCYSAFSLGANNLANVTGVYVNAGLVSPLTGALVGGGAIALGILTFSRNVMFTVGDRLVRLEGLAAFCVILGEAITLNVYAAFGVPVSASQAIVGAVLGVGLVKGARTISARTIARIGVAWVATPVVAGLIAFLLCVLAGTLGWAPSA